MFQIANLTALIISLKITQKLNTFIYTYKIKSTTLTIIIRFPQIVMCT